MDFSGNLFIAAMMFIVAGVFIFTLIYAIQFLASDDQYLPNEDTVLGKQARLCLLTSEPDHCLKKLIMECGGKDTVFVKLNPNQ